MFELASGDPFLAARAAHILCVLHDALFRTTVADRYSGLLACGCRPMPDNADGGVTVADSRGVVGNYLIVSSEHLTILSLNGMCVDGVTIGAQYAAFGNFCQDSFDPVAPTLDHIGEVN